MFHKFSTSFGGFIFKVHLIENLQNFTIIYVIETGDKT
jgi:hypothetical protein